MTQLSGGFRRFTSKDLSTVTTAAFHLCGRYEWPVDQKPGRSKQTLVTRQLVPATGWVANRACGTQTDPSCAWPIFAAYHPVIWCHHSLQWRSRALLSFVHLAA
jgi:hypothetical protein